jgi:hypothetical protein
MNKGRRTQLTELKYKKRLKNLGLKETDPNSKYYCYKSTGKPCSCPMCSPEKYKRTEKHKDRDIKNELNEE